MQCKFTLMRHAYSRHNKEKDQWKDRFGGKGYKSLPEYEISKFAPELIDSNYIEFPQEATKQLSQSQFDLVLCSPLRRCLQTCKQVLPSIGSVPVVVEPLLSNRVSAAWSIGSDSNILANQYPDFDFSEMIGRESTWMVDILSYLPRFSLEFMKKSQQQMQDFLLQKIMQGQGQTYPEFFERIQLLKKKILQVIMERCGSAPTNILIISHSCVLSFVLGKQLGEKGKVKDKISFKHCEAQEFSWMRVCQIESCK